MGASQGALGCGGAHGIHQFGCVEVVVSVIQLFASLFMELLFVHSQPRGSLLAVQAAEQVATHMPVPVLASVPGPTYVVGLEARNSGPKRQQLKLSEPLVCWCHFTHDVHLVHGALSHHSYLCLLSVVTLAPH